MPAGKRTFLSGGAGATAGESNSISAPRKTWPVASAGGHALIDRELHLPESWTADRERCRAAGIGDEVEFATTPVLAQHMIDRALDAKAPFSWLTADEAYGQVKYLRVWLEDRDISYVLATRRNDDVFTRTGAAAAPTR